MLAVAFFAVIIAITIFYIPESYFASIDKISVRQHLFAICFLQINLIIAGVWWAIYLPAPERWYLMCCRTFLGVFLASALAVASGLIPEKAYIVIPAIATAD